MYECPAERDLRVSFLEIADIYSQFPRAHIPVALDHCVIQHHCLVLEQQRCQHLACSPAFSSAPRAVVVLHILESRGNPSEAAVDLFGRVLLALDPGLVITAPSRGSRTGAIVAIRWVRVEALGYTVVSTVSEKVGPESCEVIDQIKKVQGLFSH